MSSLLKKMRAKKNLSENGQALLTDCLKISLQQLELLLERELSFLRNHCGDNVYKC